MGSFNLGCGISGLSINEGEAMGLVLLREKTSYRRPGPETPRGRALYIYCSDLYEPYLPPVYGVYDDYGRMAEVEETPTTQAIERIFRRPIEDVLNCVGQDRELYSTYGDIASVYMEKTAFEALSNYSASEEEQLVTLGFEPVTPPRGYVRAWAWGEYVLLGASYEGTAKLGMPRLKWDLQDGNERVLFTDVLALNGIEPVLSAFAAVTGCMPGFAVEDWPAVREVKALSSMVFLRRVYDDLAPVLYNTPWQQDSLDRFNKTFDGAMEELEGDTTFASSLYELRRETGMSEDWAWRELVPLAKTGEYGEIHRLKTVMTATNRMLQPSFNGEQYGNDDASGLLARISLQILEARALEED